MREHFEIGEERKMKPQLSEHNETFEEQEQTVKIVYF